MSIRGRLAELARYRLVPTITRLYVSGVNRAAKANLRRHAPVRVLVDGTVLNSATIHGTKWIETETGGYFARVNTAHRDDEHKRNCDYLVSIAHLARAGYIELLTSFELRLEQDRQKTGRYVGEYQFDYNLFTGHRIKSLDSGLYVTTSAPMSENDLREEQKERIRSYMQAEPKFAALVDVLGEKNSFDAWHLWTANRHNIDFYLTMDFKFVRTLAAQGKNKAVTDLQVKAMTPADFGLKYDIRPVLTEYLIYNDARFPVRRDVKVPFDRRHSSTDTSGTNST